MEKMMIESLDLVEGNRRSSVGNDMLRLFFNYYLICLYIAFWLIGSRLYSKSNGEMIRIES